MRLCTSISEETKTSHKIKSRKSTLGETKLIFLVYGKDSEKKQGHSVGKTKIILFDSSSQYFLKNILHNKHRRKTLNVKFIIITTNASWFWLFICSSHFISSSFKKTEDNRLKKVSLPKFFNTIFRFCLKQGQSGPQTNKLTLVCLKYFH